MDMILKTAIRQRISVIFSVVLMLLAGAATAATPSQCKGLDSDACASENSCSWVQGYERKDGSKVSAFCRTKAKAKSTSSTSSVKDSSKAS